MKFINKTKFFTIFVAVVMAITTFTSCLDPLDSANGNTIGVKTQSYNGDCNYDMLYMMYASGCYNEHLDKLSLALSKLMHDDYFFREYIVLEFADKGNAILLKHLIDEENEYEHRQYVIDALSYYSVDIDFLLSCFLNTRITLRGDVDLLMTQHISNNLDNIAVVFENSDYIVSNWTVLQGYIGGQTPFQHDNSVLYDGLMIVIDNKADKSTIVLGDEGEDPYAIHNMQQARLNLMTDGILAEEGIYMPEIEANKKYIRFLPKMKRSWIC